jgi:hypothetical protein
MLLGGIFRPRPRSRARPRMISSRRVKVDAETKEFLTIAEAGEDPCQ